MRTLGRAEPTIYGRVVCDTTSKKRKNEATGKVGRVSLKSAHWQAVMQAGLRRWPIGEYIANADDGMGPRVKLFLPDPSDRQGVSQYHNKLMMLCNVSFASLSEKMVTVASKAPRRKDQKVSDSLQKAPKEEVEGGRAASPAPELGDQAPAPAGPKKRKRLRPLGHASSDSGAGQDPAEGAGGSSQPAAAGRRTACKTRAASKRTGEPDVFGFRSC